MNIQYKGTDDLDNEIYVLHEQGQTETCKKCKTVIAEPKELMGITRV